MGDDGDDNITGQAGHDFLDGGDGRDHIDATQIIRSFGLN
jgi:Ca2+-binding RTX toxin-like protein